MIKLLTKKYPIELPLVERIKHATLIGLFVFLFIYIFQPFGLFLLDKNLFLVSLGYGFVSFISVFMLNVLFVQLFPKMFSDEKWTVGKQIIWLSLIVLLITFLNLIYSEYAGMISFTLKNLFNFMIYTSLIAIFPLSVITIFNQQRLNSKYKNESKILTDSIEENDNSDIVLVFKSENNNESLELNLDQLLFIKSEANYVDIYYLENQILKKSLLRNSLKNIEEEYPQLFRCHRSYLVNIENVLEISGNAQGYKLHFRDPEMIIPVSRSNNKLLKDRLK